MLEGIGHVDSPDTPPAPHLPKAIGDYEVLSCIGEGGMGAVYKAQQHKPISRTVAIKLLLPGHGTRRMLARLESERQALARMNHPNIAMVLDAGATETGQPYFVMEYVPGVPITEYADANKLSVRDRLLLFTQVCDAIGHAHSKGIIHRDIKASNVLAYLQDQKHAAKVIDFGIAKALEGDRLTERTLHTNIGQPLGTYLYMSPEQADGAADVDTLTDVYSLGVLLYELLTGELPFDPKTFHKTGEHEVRRIIREVDPPRPSTRLSSMGDKAGVVASQRQSKPEALAHELQRELEWIPLMAMRKERKRRYNSPQQLAEDIHNYLAGRPLIAGPESRIYRVRKFVGRKRAMLLATSVALGGLAVGGVGVALSFHGPLPAVGSATVQPSASPPPAVSEPEPPDEEPPYQPGQVYAKLPNGDMTAIANRTEPAGWPAGVRDTDVFHSAPASLRITSTAQSELLQITAGQTVLYSGWYRATEGVIGECHLNGFSADRNLRQMMGPRLFPTSEWKQFRCVALAPEGAAFSALGIYIFGEQPGSVWLDDVEISVIPRPALAFNGEMTGGEQQPDGWIPFFWYRGQPPLLEACALDSEVYRSAPSSVQLGRSGDDAEYSLRQTLPLLAGKRYRFEGWIKGTDLYHASISVIFRNAGESSMHPLTRVRTNSGWTLYRIDFTVPQIDDCPEIRLAASYQPAWFDDITVKELSDESP